MPHDQGFNIPQQFEAGLRAVSDATRPVTGRQVGFVNAFNAYKARIHAFVDENVLLEARIAELEARIRELEETNHGPDEGGVDPTE